MTFAVKKSCDVSVIIFRIVALEWQIHIGIPDTSQ